VSAVSKPAERPRSALGRTAQAADGLSRGRWSIFQRPRLLPQISRYLLREFLSSLGLCLGAFVALYLAVDFFEHLASFLSHDAGLVLIVRYFLLKIPLIVTQVIPVAVLAATLLSLGALARRGELMAMRACGISLWQIAAPIVAMCLVLSLATLAWNEYVVPQCSMRAHYVEVVEIKKKKFKGLFSDAEIWYHGENSFTNIERFDAHKNEIYGLTKYELDPEFHLRRIVEAPTVHWTGKTWETSEATEMVFADDGTLTTRPSSDPSLGLRETPDDLTAVHHDSDDLSFASLKREIREMRKKGIDTTEPTVDLWLKIAVPFVSLVMALVGIPLASRRSRSSGVAASVGAALVVGFSYWVVLALTTSLGHSGVLPAFVAAWSANVLFAVVGEIFFLGAE
jgi:lipopolysaccharide export system permease protein